MISLVSTYDFELQPGHSGTENKHHGRHPIYFEPVITFDIEIHAMNRNFESTYDVARLICSLFYDIVFWSTLNCRGPT